jgi:hypothetical protein
MAWVRLFTGSRLFANSRANQDRDWEVSGIVFTF